MHGLDQTDDFCSAGCLCPMVASKSQLFFPTLPVAVRPAEAVSIPDELTISLNWKDKKREFSYDAVFAPGTSQEKVFEDTKHLMQSAVDGYNVCIFAYGGEGGWHRRQEAQASPLPLSQQLLALPV